MHPLLEQTAHRPWPLPEGPWVQEQRWEAILFAHWPVPAALLRPHVPAPLELETWEGSAWLGITPFCLRDARLRGVPPVPLLSTFPEVDVRTYVRLDGKPAVFYLAMHAPNPVVAAAARLVYHLPYMVAEVSSETEGEWRRVRACRTRDGGQQAEWDAAYRPVSEAFQALPGTPEHFLIERWALYAADSAGHLYRAEIHRPPWPVHSAEARILKNTLAEASGIRLRVEPPLLHFSPGVPVLIWPPERVR